MASSPPELQLQRMGTSLVFVQPMEDGKASGSSVMIELQSGTVGMAEHSMPIGELGGKSATQRILGIIGLAKLANTSVLAVITSAEKVATIRANAVYKVTGTRVLETGSSTSKDDPKYIALLRKALDPSDAGKGLYFSPTVDLTLTQQRAAELEEQSGKEDSPIGGRTEQRFFWNRHLLSPFLEPTKMAIAEGGPEVDMPALPELAQFVVPLIQGSVHQISDLQLVTSHADYSGSLTLVARRSSQRPGVRHWRRGAAPDGTVANFVETEQIVELKPRDSSKPAVVSSFIQVRGSIPLLWSQIPNVKYKPPTRVSPTAATEPAFDNHISDILQSYKGVLAVNLANTSGSEGTLGKSFKQEAERFAKIKPGFEVVNFDFHHECKGMRYDRLERLWAVIEKYTDSYGAFQEGIQGQRQSGVLRINCIDCLDRTNVVQGWLARKQFDKLLTQLGLLTPGSSIKDTFPEVEKSFKWIWADHGDDISRQYAGTGALKSGFTRTGKRTTGGLIDDGVKSGVRYILNNFFDGHKQDALDLLTGTYVVKKEGPSPFKPHVNGLILIVVAFFLFFKAIISLFRTTISGPADNSMVMALFQSTLLPLAVAAALLFVLVKNGKSMVDRPQLRPELSQPWSS